MSVTNFPDGINVGDASNVPLYSFNEFVTNETVTLGEMAANETRTLVFADVPRVRGGESILCAPLTPSMFLTLEIRHCWVSAENEISIFVKNDSTDPVTYELSESFMLTYWNTSAPPPPEEP